MGFYVRDKKVKTRCSGRGISDCIQAILPTEWIKRDITPDFGLDLEIQIVKGTTVTPRTFKVQLKATESIEGNPDAYSYPMETKHLLHYEGCNDPVVVIYAIRGETRNDWTFCHLFAQKYIREILDKEDPGWRIDKEGVKNPTKVLKFPQDSKLEDEKPLTEIADQGCFELKKWQLERKYGKKIYLDDIPQSDNEELKNHVLKALKCYVEERHRDTIEILEEALRVCQPSITEKMALLLHLGNAHLLLSNYDDAMKNYKAMLELSDRAEGRSALEGKANALGSIGLICFVRGDLDEALRHHKGALEIDRKIDNSLGEAADLCNLGQIYLAKGDLREALKHNRNALKIARKVGYRQAEAATLGNIGLIHRDMVKLNRALIFLKGSLKIYREMRYRRGEAEVLVSIGWILRTRSGPALDDAWRCHQEGLNIAREIGHRQCVANHLGCLGLICSILGNSDEALKCHLEALRIDLEIGDPQGVATNLGNLGGIYADLAEWEKALNYYQDELRIDRKINHRQAEATCLGNIGLVYKQMGEWEKAMNNLKDSFDIMEKLDLVYGKDIFLKALDEVIAHINKQ